jgi:hypothetical protein
VFAPSLLQQATQSFKTNEWKKDQFLETLHDPKTWLICIYSICSSIPNSGFTSSAIIVEGISFNTFTTILIAMPGYAIGLFFDLGPTFLAHRFKYSLCLLTAAIYIIALIGCAIVHVLPTSKKWAGMGGIWLFTAYSS